jgi:cobalt/nickel transport system ATP-binding protein
MTPSLNPASSKSSNDSLLLGFCLVVVLVIALTPLKAPLFLHGFLALSSLVTVIIGKVPAPHVLSRALLILPGILAALLILPLIGQGAQRGVATALKLTSIMFCLAWLTWKLPPHRMFSAMESLRFPQWLTEILRSMYRNLAILGREVSSMRQALKSRIVRPGAWLVQAAGNMVSLLFLRTQVRAASQVVARDSRCHGAASPKMAEPPSIEIKNVSYCYSGAGHNALYGICLNIPAHAKVAILGCNGAGKTTLLLQLNAVFPLQSGRISISGIEMEKANRSQIRQEVGMLFQNPDDQILGLSIEEDVAIGPNQLPLSDDERMARIETALRQVGLWNRRDQPPHQLSSGERKRLALAGLLASGSRILLLDEPMASLDPPGRDAITVLLDDLHRDDRTVVAATHDVDFVAEWASIVVLMDGGHIVAAGPPDLLTNTELMASAGLALPRISQAFAEFQDEHRGVGNDVPRTRDRALEWLRKRFSQVE